MTFINFMKRKSELPFHLMNFISFAEVQTGNKLRCLRSDNGGEYKSVKNSEFLTKKDILHETTAPYSPQQNGIAERTNCILIENARSMMFEMNVTMNFCADSVVTAAYLRNLTTSEATH